MKFEIGPGAQEEVWFKYLNFSIFSSGKIYLARRNSLHNFGRGPYEVHLCEIILNLDQLFRMTRLKKKVYTGWTKNNHKSSP